jgi:hypothetical protein
LSLLYALSVGFGALALIAFVYGISIAFVAESESEHLFKLLFWCCTVSTIITLGCFVGVVLQADRQESKRDRVEARTVLAAAVKAERRFYASHGVYGTLDIDLARSDPALIARLHGGRHLAVELGGGDLAVKLTATVRGQHASALLDSK